MKIKMIVLLSLLTMAEQAAGSFETGASLLSYCDSKPGFEQGVCSGFIVSVSDTHNTLANWRDLPKAFCIPAGVSRGQIREVFIKYAKEHPNKLHTSASSLVINAFIQAFHCGNHG